MKEAAFQGGKKLKHQNSFMQKMDPTSDDWPYPVAPPGPDL
jgi:hypothetical protein